MFRSAVVAPLLLCLSVPTGAAEWSKKLFAEYSHDFGTVARAAKAEHVFEMTNPFKETIHIASVRASCGCSTPTIMRDTLETWEKGGIHVRYNTRGFTGQRGATITVVIDQPFYDEVQLEVRGYIRSDVVIHPGVIQFETVDQGQGGKQKVSVNYAGRSDWQIVDVRSANTNFEVELEETRRAAGRVDYQLLVRLKESMPAGYFNDELVLVTNDLRKQQVPVRIEGNVVPGLTVSPASLYLGVIKPGDKITKTLVVKGKQPFRIKSVKCADGCFEFKPSTESKNLHVVPVVFTAHDPGQIKQQIQIETDMDTGSVATCLATATIEPAPPAGEAETGPGE